MTPIDEAPKLAPFTLRGHNPDVLNTIANLSNDEVFTPPELANQMLDMLEKAWADGNNGANIWADHTVAFLDPFTKSGVFLREITARLVKGLEEWMPDLQQRVNHILTKQVFGIGITQLTSLLARRSVYCSKSATGKHSIVKTFDRDWGNIWFERTEHTWAGGTEKVITMDENGKTVLKATNGRCKYCGASQKEYERSDALESHAYAFIHTDDIKARMAELFGENMHFDVVIGNPPYQLDTGGSGRQAKPIYNLFVEQAKRLEPRYLSMIIQSRWFGGGMGLNDFRSSMLNDRRLRHITDFVNSNDVFPGTDFGGGVNYFLWDRDHEGSCMTRTVYGGQTYEVTRDLAEFTHFIRFAPAVPILRKVLSKSEGSVRGIVSSTRPFGIPTTRKPDSSGDLRLVSSKGDGWVKRSEATAGHQYIDTWNVLTSKTSHDHAGLPDRNGQRRVLSRLEVIPPGTVCSESYIVIGSFANEIEAHNCKKYLSTRLARFLIALLSYSQDITSGRFEYVPLVDFSKEWDDESLRSLFDLTGEEMDFVRKLIRSMGAEDE